MSGWLPCGMTDADIDRAAPDYRIVLCEACGSEGRILTNNGGPDDIDHGECPYCEGTGGEIVSVQPIEMSDLDEDRSCNWEKFSGICMVCGAGPDDECEIERENRRASK